MYSILATDKSDQFVRVFTTYPPSISTPTSNTAEYPITDAAVTIQSGGTTYPLFLATLPRTDSSRYTTPIYAYRSIGLSLQYGATYALQIQSPSVGNLSATLTVPSQPGMLMNQRWVLERPGLYLPTEKMQMTATIPPGAAAYLFRLLISYDVLEESGWVRKRAEIPARFRGDLHTLENAIYGQVTRVQTPAVVNAYTAGVYTAVLGDVYERTKPYKLVFNYAILQFVQLEKNFYHYYSSVKGFQDPFSIRLDQSNYSNIVNGAGIFAGCTVDSLVQILPNDFTFNRR